ncbi:hypothetical protein ACHAW5_007683 [Stephanodiscus triporus]|uniref:Uncharacterized protein n=1 Tax=Stephanodiscus triporus TaxID=2934178 RepID=A0ABD3NJ82_9STRA
MDLSIRNGNRNKQQQQAVMGGNGTVYEQECKHGEVCDHDDVALSVIKGGVYCTAALRDHQLYGS